MISNGAGARIVSSSLRILGVCWAVCGVIRLITAVWLVLFTGTATLMFGALLARAPDPFTLMSTFHFVYAVVVVLAAASGLIGLLAGLALLAGSPSARVLALVAGFLSLSNIPLGTTLGIYTLLILLPLNAAEQSSRAGKPVALAA